LEYSFHPDTISPTAQALAGVMTELPLLSEQTAPTSVEEFQARLAAISDDLPRRLKQCADFIAANTDRIAVSTVAELAAGADVPPSALMRFCQILGFSGFSEMQGCSAMPITPAGPIIRRG
jgi:hypothetical protein